MASLAFGKDYVKSNPEVVAKWLESHEETTNWINENQKETRIIFNEFMLDTMGQSLSDAVIDESLVHLEITTDSIDDSIHTFAQRADSLGYLGRDGYSLDGIFFDIASNESLEENR